MKTLMIVLFAVLLTIPAMGQYVLMDSTGTVLYKDKSQRGAYTFITISDISDSKKDSLIAEVYDKDVAEWLPIGVMPMTARDWESTMSPGDGESAIYLVNYPTPVQLRVKRLKSVSLSGSTKINIEPSGVY